MHGRETGAAESFGCTTIGHSSHPIGDFIALLQRHAVSCVIDVRSVPYSRFNPQFNRESLKTDLEIDEIFYLFLGGQLGARRSDPQLLFPDGTVDFAKVRLLPDFGRGIDRVLQKIREHGNIALMCAEKDPFSCHRFLLVSPALARRGVAVAHILSTGETISQQALEDRLIKKYGMDTVQASLFEPTGSRHERLAEAYARRNREMGCFSKPDGHSKS